MATRNFDNVLSCEQFPSYWLLERKSTGLSPGLELKVLSISPNFRCFNINLKIWNPLRASKVFGHGSLGVDSTGHVLYFVVRENLRFKPATSGRTRA